MSPTPAPTRRSSRIHTSGSTRMTLNLHHTDTDHSRYSRRTTPTIGTLPPTSQSYSSSTIPHKYVTGSSQKFNSTNTRTSKRARPRWYRPPPPEAYLIIRAHRRPIGGWGEDWSRKGDGWYVAFLILTILHRLGVDTQDIQIIYYV
jgi:hypothetical protein